MAVSVSNRFEALLSDSDGEGSRTKGVSAKAKPQPKQQQGIPGFQQSASIPGVSGGFRQVEARDRQAERPRGPRRQDQGQAGGYGGFRAYNDNYTPAEGSDHSGDGFNEKPRLSRPGGRRPARGRGGGAGPSTRRREFDRRSGDPKQPGPRKDGAGAYNWGSNAEVDGSKAVDQEGAPHSGSDVEEKANEQTAEGGAEGAAEAGEGAGNKEREEEEEEERIDFEEYQRQQQARRAQLNLRAVAQARNVDAAELEAEGYERLERKDSDERPNSREGRIHNDEDDDARKPKRFNFFDLALEAGNYRSYGSRGGRGGRGGERGGRGRRGGRDGGAPAGDQPKPKKHIEKVQLDLTNADAFPALN